VAEAPVLVVVPAQPTTQQYCTIVDIRFNIDKGDIQPEDREKLRVLGTFLAKYPGTTGVIESHSDNVGAADYNLKLSPERAQGVVTYLVTELHIDRSRLSAVGYGDTRPVADNATADGKRTIWSAPSASTGDV
jgi:OOP family OmpA-OmpF porin